MGINKERLLEEFLELVQIDSATGDERLIADRLTDKLTSMGFSVSEDNAGAKIGGNTGNLIARLKGNASAPTLLFCAHMDRVTPGKCIKPSLENGVVKSDGSTILAADDLAGVVAILEGLRTVQEKGANHGDVEVVFTIAEEGGLRGAKNLDYAQLKAEMGYFLDSGDPVGTIVTRAPGNTHIDFEIKGKAAHAGNSPEKGLSAIVVASHAITKMKLGRIDSETTANIGVFNSGTATNIVPDMATLRAEARSLNPEKLERQIQGMADAVRSTVEEFGADADIRIEVSYQPFHVAAESPVVSRAVEAAKAIGLEPALTATGGGSDANIVNGNGIPSVVLGVGFEDVHSKQESINVANLERSAEYVASIIEISK